MEEIINELVRREWNRDYAIQTYLKYKDKLKSQTVSEQATELEFLEWDELGDKVEDHNAVLEYIVG